MTRPQRFKASYYNLRVVSGTTTLLFNGVTGGLLRLTKAMARDLDPLLGPQRARTAGTGYATWEPPRFGRADLPASIKPRFNDFLDSGVFVAADRDERDELHRAYAADRSNTPFLVTITTTLDCNMRCYYCYQKEGELESMSPEMSDAIAAWTKAEIEKNRHSICCVDWYGGEPMLNQGVINRYSEMVTAFCDARGVDYRGSMICNGTAWPDDPVAFVERNRLRNIQFSIDGPRQHHNKRRGLIDAKGGSGRSASFETVMRTIGALVGRTRIYLRINVDPWIGRDCLEVIDECAARGWLDPDTQFYPYLAVINAMTEHCGFIAKAKRFEEFSAEFDRIQQEFYARLRQYRDERSFEVVQYFPNRVKVNCAAVSNNAVVFGPNGRVYKCGLDVGDQHRAHAVLNADAPIALEPRQGAPDALAADRWDRYDPFTHARCRECQYLPICMGGCPKAQIERDEAQIRMQSEFWENNFDRIVQEYFAAAGGH